MPRSTSNTSTAAQPGGKTNRLRVLVALLASAAVFSACGARADVVASAVAGTLTAQAPTSVLAAGRATSTPVPTVLATTAAPPTPTETVAPSETPDAEAELAEAPAASDRGALVYEEAFDDVGAWAVGETDANNVQIADGVMQFTQKNAGTFAFRITGRQADAFQVELTTRVGGACRTNDRYGIIFRLQDGVNYYLFLVDCERRYRVLRVEAGALIGLSEWTESELIVAGAGAENVLAVRGADDRFDFFINAEHVMALRDDRYRGGRFGVWVGAGASSNFTVFFDDLRIYSLP